MSCDIISGSIADSTSLNQFTYVNGNPISFVDPFGMSAERVGSSDRNTSWAGAAYLERVSTETINETFDLSLGTGIVQVSHVQTFTTTKTNGTEGKWFGAYSYSELLLDTKETSVGVGIDFLYLIGLDINVKWLGLEASASLNIDNMSLSVDIDLNLAGYSTAGIGIINTSSNGDEINDVFSIDGNTAALLSVVVFILTGVYEGVEPVPAY